MTKPVFVLLSGLPGSGKSTFRALPVFDDYVHLSTDDIVEAFALQVDKTYDDVWSVVAPTAAAAINSAFEGAIKARKSIIWDQTNLAAKKRKALLSRLPKGYFSVAVCFQIDEGLRQERLRDRPGKTIPAHVDRQMQAVFVPPDTSEGFNLVTHPQDSFFSVKSAA
jgi:predicted kinase